MSDWARRLSCSAVCGGRIKEGLGGGVTSVGGVEVLEGGELKVEAVEMPRCAVPGSGCSCCETPDLVDSIRVLSYMYSGGVENGPI
jgi:hypothetical protein